MLAALAACGVVFPLTLLPPSLREHVEVSARAEARYRFTTNGPDIQRSDGTVGQAYPEADFVLTPIGAIVVESRTTSLRLMYAPSISYFDIFNANPNAYATKPQVLHTFSLRSDFRRRRLTFGVGEDVIYGVMNFAGLGFQAIPQPIPEPTADGAAPPPTTTPVATPVRVDTRPQFESALYISSRSSAYVSFAGSRRDTVTLSGGYTIAGATDFGADLVGSASADHDRRNALPLQVGPDATLRVDHRTSRVTTTGIGLTFQETRINAPKYTTSPLFYRGLLAWSTSHRFERQTTATLDLGGSMIWAREVQTTRVPTSDSGTAEQVSGVTRRWIPFGIAAASLTHTFHTSAPHGIGAYTGVASVSPVIDTIANYAVPRVDLTNGVTWNYLRRTTLRAQATVGRILGGAPGVNGTTLVFGEVGANQAFAKWLRFDGGVRAGYQTTDLDPTANATTVNAPPSLGIQWVVFAAVIVTDTFKL